ncbi:MAG: thiamine phosphate synthase [Oscillospiraceae bacterium]
MWADKMGENFDKIICVTNRKLCEKPLEEQLAFLVKKGISRVILREKDLPEEEYAALAKQVLGVPKIELFIHNFPNVARELSVKKIHLPLAKLTREICAEFEVVGASVHSVEEAIEAEKLGASYVTAGHIFATDCKKGLPPRGLEFLENVCKSVKIPVYAIGGISRSNMYLALEAGAAGVCVMSGLMNSTFFE